MHKFSLNSGLNLTHFWTTRKYISYRSNNHRVIRTFSPPLSWKAKHCASCMGSRMRQPQQMDIWVFFLLLRFACARCLSNGTAATSNSLGKLSCRSSDSLKRLQLKKVEPFLCHPYCTHVQWWHIYLFIYYASSSNAIQYTGGVDWDTTTAGSQLLWAHIVSWGGDFVTHSLAPLLVRFVKCGLRLNFQTKYKVNMCPRAKDNFGFIFSCENLTNIGQMSLCCKYKTILSVGFRWWKTWHSGLYRAII